MTLKMDVVLIVSIKQNNLLIQIPEVKSLLLQAETKCYEPNTKHNNAINPLLNPPLLKAWGYLWKNIEWYDSNPSILTLSNLLIRGQYNIIRKIENENDIEFISTSTNLPIGNVYLSL